MNNYLPKGIHFSKIVCFGNDYIIIDSVTQNVRLHSNLIKDLAERKKGIGFHRLIIIEPPFHPNDDFHVFLFNREGKKSDIEYAVLFCVAFFVRDKNLCLKDKIKIGTAKLSFSLVFESQNLLSLLIKMPNFEPEKMKFRARKREKNYLQRLNHQTIIFSMVSYHLDYCVIFVDEFIPHEFTKLIKDIRAHERFSKQTQICFAKINNEKSIEVWFNQNQDNTFFSLIESVSAVFSVSLDLDYINSNENIEIKTPFQTLFAKKQSNNEILISTKIDLIFDGILRMIN